LGRGGQGGPREGDGYAQPGQPSGESVGRLHGSASHDVASGLDGPAEAASKDLDAVELLDTTQEQVSQTVAVVANYGGSLDTILEDA